MDDVGLDATRDLEALLQFMYLAPVGLVQIRRDGEVLMMNPRCAQWLMPLAPHGELDNLFTALHDLAPDLPARVAAFGEPSGRICEGLHLPVRAGRPGGLPAQVLSLTLMQLDQDRLMAVLDDITEQLRRERALRHSQAWLHSMVRGVQDYALVALDASGRVQAWNESIERLVGDRRDALLGRPFVALLADADGERRAEEALREADAAGWSFDECRLQHADGTCIWASSLIAPQRPPGSDGVRDGGYSLILHDIGHRREALESLRRAVSCDHLTGLANRRAFFDAGVHELERCTRLALPLSVLMFDADHFKAINDGHGHAAGDAVLRHLADTLSASFRESDVVARLGGEEFVVLLPGTPAAEAEAAAERVCQQLRARPARLGSLQITCTVSAGLAQCGVAGDDLDSLLQRADTALYAAKAAGRDRVCRWQPGLAPDPAPATAVAAR